MQKKLVTSGCADATKPRVALSYSRYKKAATLKGATATSRATEAQPGSIKALAERVLRRNRQAQLRRNQVVAPPRENDLKSCYQSCAPYAVFEYQLAGSDRWLVLFSIVPGDTVARVEEHLTLKFGCAVRVRRKGGR
jgi:hypothetical protein